MKIAKTKFLDEHIGLQKGEQRKGPHSIDYTINN